MVVAIRLTRMGRVNRPFYRIVVADSRSPRDGRFLEQVGTYNPLRANDGSKEVTLDFDRAKYWLSVGAQPSDRVSKLFGLANLLPMPPVPVHRAAAPTSPAKQALFEKTAANKK